MVLSAKDQLDLNRKILAVIDAKKRILAQVFPNATPDQYREIKRGVAYLYQENPLWQANTSPPVPPKTN